jgi:AraC family transcriptional regulator
VQGKVECGMSSSPQTATWRSGIPIAVNLPDMTVVGPTDMGIPEHEHPEIQISMTFVAHSPLGRTKAARGFPTYFSLHPSGMPHGRKSDGAESLATVFSQAYIEQAADELLKRSSSEIISAPCAVDPVILSMGMVLRGELLQGPVRDPLLVEAVGVVLTGHLVRRWSSQPSLRQVKGQLSARQIRNTLEVIEHSLPSGIRVRDLANQNGMGTHQFTRLFRQTMGCSPYRFVMLRRVEKACFLLEKTLLPLVEIALELGFVSQSHFTSVFHREMRTTPASYRSAFQIAGRRRVSS